MDVKKWGFTDLIALITSGGLGISLASQTYFYYRLDSLWIISILPISVYFLDVLKVTLLIFLIIGFVGACKFLYKLIYKKFFRKKINLASDFNLFNFISIEERKHILYFSYATVILAQCVFEILRYIGFIIAPNIQFWTSFVIGLTITLFNSHKISKGALSTVVILIVISVAILNAEIKLNAFENNPYVYYKGQISKELMKSKLLEAYQDKLIVLERDDNKTIIKILKIEQIEKIVSDEPNH